jgi:hypothetical protein
MNLNESIIGAAVDWLAGLCGWPRALPYLALSEPAAERGFVWGRAVGGAFAQNHWPPEPAIPEEALRKVLRVVIPKLTETFSPDPARWSAGGVFPVR